MHYLIWYRHQAWEFIQEKWKKSGLMGRMFCAAKKASRREPYWGGDAYQSINPLDLIQINSNIIRLQRVHLGFLKHLINFKYIPKFHSRDSDVDTFSSTLKREDAACSSLLQLHSGTPERVLLSLVHTTHLKIERIQRNPTKITMHLGLLSRSLSTTSGIPGDRRGLQTAMISIESRTGFDIWHLLIRVISRDQLIPDRPRGRLRRIHLRHLWCEGLWELATQAKDKYC